MSYTSMMSEGMNALGADVGMGWCWVDGLFPKLVVCVFSGSMPRLYAVADEGLMDGLCAGLRFGVVVAERVGLVVSKMRGDEVGCLRGDLFLSVRACTSSTVVFSLYLSSDLVLEVKLSGEFSLDWGMAGRLLTKLECICMSKMDDVDAFENCGAWTGSRKWSSIIARTSADAVLCFAFNSDSCLAWRCWSACSMASGSPSILASELSISSIVSNSRAAT